MVWQQIGSIGDLVYMRDVAPARFGRRRGPAAAMVSTQGTLGSTFRDHGHQLFGQTLFR